MNNQVQLPSIQNLLNSLNHDDNNNNIVSKTNTDINNNSSSSGSSSSNSNNSNNNNSNNDINSNDSNNIPIFLPDPFKKTDMNKQNNDTSNDIKTLVPLPTINTMVPFKSSSTSSVPSPIINNNIQSMPCTNSFPSISLQQHPPVPRINPERKSNASIESIISNIAITNTSTNFDTLTTTKDRNDSNEIKGTVYSKSSSRKIVTAKTIPCKINYEKDGLKIISRKHCRYNLPKDCVTILNDWLMDHLHNPYPTAQEKRDLLIKTGLTKIQLSNWFINQRRRKIFNGYYSLAKSISEDKGNNDLPCNEVKVPLTKRKKLMDRIDELKQLMGEESS